MYRAAPRLLARSALPRSVAPAKRYISTAPPTQKSRSWKSLAARFGIAGTLIYYYNTTDVFAEEPRHAIHQSLPEAETESEHLPTIESISAERQKRKAVQAQLDAQKEAQSTQAQAQQSNGAEGGIGGLEAEADQQGAFNPETGEINWDCPCLGGMATGPCGEQFKAAFSCFVYSTEEPKGVDCIEKFKDMQNCFREYPEVYGSELEGDEEDDMTADRDQPVAADSASSQPSGTSSESSDPTGLSSPQAQSDKEKVGAATPKQPGSPSPDAYGRQERAKAATAQVVEDYGDAENEKSAPAKSQPSSIQKPETKSGDTKRAEEATKQVKEEHPPQSESDSLVPRASHNATGDNEKAK